MKNGRKLPIGIQDFVKLRTDNYLYVDKTDYLYQLVSTSQPYFLSRPRRFGKSLFLSTLKAYFLGKKELFENLKIYDLEKKWEEYPIIHLDMNVGNFESKEAFLDRLDVLLQYYENQWGKLFTTHDVSSRFEALIRTIFQKTAAKKGVVVLVDEYDKPLLESIDNIELNDEIRKTLKSFYGVLKSNDACLRFVFLTGVTKFSKVSVFSDLNHLTDISLDNKFSGICGISENELIHYFQPEIEAIAEEKSLTYEETLAKLKKHYDGYHFAKNSEGVYNPCSLLNTFDKKDFYNYWFKTGTPTFLIKLMKAKNFNVLALKDSISISADSIDDFRIENDNIVPVLYQSGYLTIINFNEKNNSFLLGFPNEEVKYGFLNELLPAYVPKVSQTRDFYIGNFIEDLESNNIETFLIRLRAFFSNIPYVLENKTEKHFQTIFYLLFELMGQFIEVEPYSAIGRADAVIKTATHVYVFEFKIAIKESYKNSPEYALRQISEKKYTLPYTASGKKLVKIGMEFDLEGRTVGNWKIDYEN